VLGLVGGQAHDAPHLGNEPHVEHAVGLVDDQHLDLVEIDIPTVAEIQQSPRGGHQNVAVALMQVLALAIVIHAADQGVDLQVGVLAQRLGVLGDLHHQFPGGGDHQGAGLAGEALLLLHRVLEQVGDDGDQESGGLAGAGLRLAHHIVTAQREGQ